MAVFTIFFQMLALLLMIGAGYLMAKKKMVDEHTNGQISRMIINVFNPLLFLSSAFESVGTISMSTMLQIGLVAAGMFVFFIAAGMLLTPFFDKDQDQRKIFQMMFVFSNLGFIGIPVINSILGAEYVVYVTGFLVVYNIVFLHLWAECHEWEIFGGSAENHGKSGQYLLCDRCGGVLYGGAGPGIYQYGSYVPGQCRVAAGAGTGGIYAGALGV